MSGVPSHAVLLRSHDTPCMIRTPTNHAAEIWTRYNHVCMYSTRYDHVLVLVSSIIEYVSCVCRKWDYIFASMLSCAVHLFWPYFTTSMFVWLPGTALVTTALCWLPGRCWSYSQYSLEICYATECFWYWKPYIISWRLWQKFAMLLNVLVL